MVKANAGHVEEGQELFAKALKGFPEPLKNIRFFMSAWQFDNPQVMQRMAEGYSKAGLPGDPNDFYKVSAENRLSGDEIKTLFFGKKVAGTTIAFKKPWSIERKKDGSAAITEGDKTDTGKSWVEEDMLCDQWDNFYEGLRDCWVIYRNPEGTPENQDEYLGAPGYGLYPFSAVERK